MDKTKSLKDNIALAFPDAEFDSHATDLYVKSTPEIIIFLKENYEFYGNIVSFRSTNDGSLWLDIPFVLMDENFNK